ncbi:MAG: hypothetical protein AB7E80_16830 [Hyphomicrobiaceae bacterium]
MKTFVLAALLSIAAAASVTVPAQAADTLGGKSVHERLTEQGS